jgi:hypothetical protein
VLHFFSFTMSVLDESVYNWVELFHFFFFFIVNQNYFYLSSWNMYVFVIQLQKTKLFQMIINDLIFIILLSIWGSWLSFTCLSILYFSKHPSLYDISHDNGSPLRILRVWLYWATWPLLLSSVLLKLRMNLVMFSRCFMLRKQRQK